MQRQLDSSCAPPVTCRPVEGAQVAASANDAWIGVPAVTSDRKPSASDISMMSSPPVIDAPKMTSALAVVPLQVSCNPALAVNCCACSTLPPGRLRMVSGPLAGCRAKVTLIWPDEFNASGAVTEMPPLGTMRIWLPASRPAVDAAG